MDFLVMIQKLDSIGKKKPDPVNGSGYCRFIGSASLK